LQNIPVRTAEGRAIRKAFVADKGKKLISADYSQIELRVLAHMADTPTLRQAFADGLDIHAMTASEMFGVPIEGMDPNIRRRAKAINFGIVYGISSVGLAAQLGIGRSAAGIFSTIALNCLFSISKCSRVFSSFPSTDFLPVISAKKTIRYILRDKNAAIS
jgi:DNA polymerase-1